MVGDSLAPSVQKWKRGEGRVCYWLREEGLGLSEGKAQWRDFVWGVEAVVGRLWISIQAVSGSTEKLDI